MDDSDSNLIDLSDFEDGPVSGSLLMREFCFENVRGVFFLDYKGEKKSESAGDDQTEVAFWRVRGNLTADTDSQCSIPLWADLQSSN